MATQPTFEKALHQLETIVQALETGNLPLDEAMKKFEEGMKLSRYCAQKLDESEQKITLLTRDPEKGIVEEPFFPGDGSPETT